MKPHGERPAVLGHLCQSKPRLRDQRASKPAKDGNFASTFVPYFQNINAGHGNAETKAAQTGAQRVADFRRERGYLFRQSLN
jgi:hypothetical protein